MVIDIFDVRFWHILHLLHLHPCYVTWVLTELNTVITVAICFVSQLNKFTPYIGVSPKYLALIDVKKESISCLTSVLYHYENPCFCNDLLNVLILPNKLEGKYKSNLYMVMLFHKEFATISLLLWSLSIVLIQ